MVVDYSRFENLDDSDEETAQSVDAPTPTPPVGAPSPDVGCEHCGKKCQKLLLCSCCKAVSYCSPACQKADWSVHKRFCKKPVTMEDRLKQQFPGMQCFGGASSLSAMTPPVKLKAADAKAEKDSGSSAEVSTKPSSVKYTPPSTNDMDKAADGKAAAAEPDVAQAPASDTSTATCQNCARACTKPLRCSACKDATYCSAKCQKDDWSYHKRTCRTSKTVLCGCCGSTIKEGVVFCRSCGVRRPDLDKRPGESIPLKQQAAPEKVEDEDIQDWYRHREWQPSEGKKEFKPTLLTGAAADAIGSGSTREGEKLAGGYGAATGKTETERVACAAEIAAVEVETPDAEVPSAGLGEIPDLAQGLATSILVGALSAASGADEADRAVATTCAEHTQLSEDNEDGPLEAADGGRAEAAEPSDAVSGRAEEASSSSDAEQRMDMLPWWADRMADVDISGKDGDVEYQMDAPTITSGEVWASQALPGRQHSVDFRCNAFFSVDMMETSASGFRMQTSSSGVMSAQVRLAEDQKLEIIAEKVEGADVVVSLAKDFMVPVLKERFNDMLTDFYAKLDAELGIVEGNWKLLD